MYNDEWYHSGLLSLQEISYSCKQNSQSSQTSKILMYYICNMGCLICIPDAQEQRVYIPGRPQVLVLQQLCNFCWRLRAYQVINHLCQYECIQSMSLDIRTYLLIVARKQVTLQLCLQNKWTSPKCIIEKSWKSSWVNQQNSQVF